MLCYYCEASEATTERLSQPACETCQKCEIRVIPNKQSRVFKGPKTDLKAEHLKMLISAHRFAFEKKNNEK